MRKTITKKNLGELLNKSEKHAIEYCAESRRNQIALYEHQLEEGFLSMNVSIKNVKRAIKILEQLIITINKAGFSVTVEYDGYKLPASAILIDDIVVPFRIKEKMLSHEEQDGSITRRVYTPTNEMTLELYTRCWHWKPSKVFADTAYTKLEDKISDVVPYLKIAAEEIKETRKREEMERKAEEEKKRMGEERNKRIAAKAYIVKYILRDINLYEKAKVIRDYCDKVAPKIHFKDYDIMIEIARSFADWIDPTVDYVDKDLEEMYNKSYFFK